MQPPGDDKPTRSSSASRRWDALRDYRPRKATDYLFLHGIAIHAARRALREGPPLYLPAEWCEDEASDTRQDLT